MNQYDVRIKASPLDRDSLLVEFYDWGRVDHVWYYTKDVSVVMWSHIKLWVDHGKKP